MTTYKHTLLDVIACSWWPNDGPVHLRERERPFDEELVVKYEQRPLGETTLTARVLAVVERAGPIPADEIAQRLGLSSQPKRVSARLADLHSVGRVHRVNGGWAIADGYVDDDDALPSAAE